MKYECWFSDANLELEDDSDIEDENNAYDVQFNEVTKQLKFDEHATIW